MVETFEALAVLLLGLLPGAAYVWAYERQIGVSRAGIVLQRGVSGGSKVENPDRPGSGADAPHSP